MPASVPLDKTPRVLFRLDFRLGIAILYTTLALAFLHRYARPAAILQFLPQGLRGARIQLNVRLVWAALHTVCYVIVPLGMARRLGLGAVELGLRRQASRKYVWIVAAVAGIAIPCVLFVSHRDMFLGAYPMYRPAPLDAVSTLLWFGLLASYLFSIEHYYRGFLQALFTPALGRYALFGALVPYVATHEFLPEALGAIPVGLLLGILRMRARSLWPGYLAHLCVALQIELIAQYRHGLF